MKSKSIIFTSVFVALIASHAYARIHIVQDVKRRTTAVSGLVIADNTCNPRQVSGSIIKRDFENDEVTLKGIVIERADGVREYINVEIPDQLDMATRRAVFDGLQRLTRAGRVIYGRVFACGVSGGVLTLDSIR